LLNVKVFPYNSLNLSAYSENTRNVVKHAMENARKVCKHIRKMRGKYLIISVYGQTANVELFSVHRSVSEYAESINLIRKICRKNLCIYGEHEKSLSANPNSAIFKINPQIRKFLENTPQLFPKTVPKVVFVNVFMFKFESEHNICFMCKEKKYQCLCVLS
jgi:hypothetical protein